MTGYNITVTPYLIIKDASGAIEYYKRVFGAELISLLMIGEKVGHAELRIGSNRIMLAGEFPEWGMTCPDNDSGSPVILMMMVEDADAVVRRAAEGGATIIMPVRDQFYGDRSGTITDPFGHKWTIATHIEEVSDEEMKKRAESMLNTPGS